MKKSLKEELEFRKQVRRYNSVLHLTHGIFQKYMDEHPDEDRKETLMDVVQSGREVCGWIDETLNYFGQSDKEFCKYYTELMENKRVVVPQNRGKGAYFEMSLN